MKVLAKKRKEMKERPLNEMRNEKTPKSAHQATKPGPKREEGRGTFGPLL